MYDIRADEKNDQYRSTDFIVPGPGKLQLVYKPTDGKEPTVLDVYNFKGKGVAMSMYNTDEVCGLLMLLWNWQVWE